MWEFRSRGAAENLVPSPSTLSICASIFDSKNIIDRNEQSTGADIDCLKESSHKYAGLSTELSLGLLGELPVPDMSESRSRAALPKNVEPENRRRKVCGISSQRLASGKLLKQILP